MMTSLRATLRRAARWLRNRLTPSALILLYHRVAELPTDPHWLCVSPGHFTEQLEVLRRQARPLRLQEFVRGRLPRRSVIVTFDDGHGDNLHQAKPLLERYDVPATVFVATGCTGKDREFWWDEVDRLVLQPGTVPATLRLRVNGGTREWDLGEEAHYGEDAFQRHRRWLAPEQPPATVRQRLFCDLHHLLRPLPDDEQRAALEQLRVWAGAGTEGRPSHRALSAEEVVRLANGGLVEIGAHTVNHPALSALPAEAQREEIQRSKAELEKLLERPVSSFAYPYGTVHDYTPQTVAIVREAGFACACSNFEGAARRGSDPHQLPRFVVRDWDGDAFARRLKEWFDA